MGGTLASRHCDLVRVVSTALCVESHGFLRLWCWARCWVSEGTGCGLFSWLPVSLALEVSGVGGGLVVV